VNRPTAGQQAAELAILDWAEQHAPDMTISQIAALAADVDQAIRQATRQVPDRRPVGLTTKAGATPDDARRIAARLEAQTR
jgi:hypothetical protein